MTTPAQHVREASLAQFRAFTGGPTDGPLRDRAEQALGVRPDPADSATGGSVAGGSTTGGSTTASETASGGSGHLSRRAS